MPVTRWDERFFSSTRGRIVALLRRASHTVDELAQALGLTDNAVRAHLATLERDGLVYQSGLRRGAGKPAYAYTLTPEAERLFPKAYGQLLHTLLDVLAERLPSGELEGILREVGRRAAQPYAAGAVDARGRVARALEVIQELGGLAEAEVVDGRVLIRGFSCPLAEALPGHPEVCALAAALLSEIVGAPVQERCAREAPPRCRFEVALESPAPR